MKVKDIMTRYPICITKEHTFEEIARLFIEHHIDGIPILDENNRLSSIITKTDIIKAFANGVSPSTPIESMKLKKLITIDKDADIKDAYKLDVGRLPVTDSKGDIVGMLTRTDLSKKLLEREVQQSKELKAVLYSTNNGIITINNKGDITNCNPSAIRILDLESKNPIGSKIKKILPQLKLHETLKNKVTTYTETIEFKDKKLICDRIPLFSEDAESFADVDSAVIVFKDSFDLERTIDELNTVQQLSQKLDAVIESSYDGIFTTDGQANTMKINKAYERITGVKRDEMIGVNMIELEKSKFISESATLKVLKTKKTTTVHQKFKTGKDALVTSTPIFDKNGKISMVVTNVRDITELACLKEQLAKNKELAQKYYSEIEEMRVQLLNTLHVIAQDEKMLETMQIAKRVARVDTTILLLGETGVGKEEAAKFIHKNSNRSKDQFIKINCGAIPENLIESELFGYERGSFTGANSEGKMGLFEVANGGTLFLDEIGELSLDMQVKLLRALQEMEIKRVGGTKSVKIDVRILAATNRDLEDMVRQKLFRKDFYYRLSVIPINIPPLRERRGDIIPLVKHFLGGLNQKYSQNKNISSEVLSILYDYDWPGNVRELKNIVERIFIMSRENVIGFDVLPKTMIPNGNASDCQNHLMSLKDAVARTEFDLMEKSFKKHQNVRDAAKELGIDASTFVRKRKKYKDKF